MFFSFLASFVSETVEAKDTISRLNCSWEGAGNAPLGSPRYSIIKKESKGKEPKYLLGVKPIHPKYKEKTYKLVSTGSGDEDYYEYVVVGAKENSPINRAKIHEDFEWATINGDHFYYRCD